MISITKPSGSVLYLELLDQLLAHGVSGSLEGQPTRELTDVQLIITSPRYAHTLETSRRHSARITATETAHLIAGVSSLWQLDDASDGQFSEFADRGRLRGAYGPLVYQQLEKAIQSLADSTMAVIILNNGTGSASGTNAKFMVDDGKLHISVSVHCLDAFSGFPIDLEMFAALQKTVAATLGIPAGQYTHAVGSFHLYDHDFERAKAILEAGLGRETRRPILPEGALPAVTDLAPLQRWHASRQAAEDVVMFQPDAKPLFEEEDWLAWKEWQYALAGRIPRLPVTGTAWQVCPHCRYITAGECPECPFEPAT